MNIEAVGFFEVPNIESYIPEHVRLLSDEQNLTKLKKEIPKLDQHQKVYLLQYALDNESFDSYALILQYLPDEDLALEYNSNRHLVKHEHGMTDEERTLYEISLIYVEGEMDRRRQKVGVKKAFTEAQKLKSNKKTPARHLGFNLTKELDKFL